MLAAPSFALVESTGRQFIGTEAGRTQMPSNELSPLPTAEALSMMRKNARKRKVPKLDVGSHGHLPGVGQFKIIEAEGTVCLEWQMTDGITKRLYTLALRAK